MCMGVDPSTGARWLLKGHIPKENWLFLSQPPSVANSCTARGGTFWSPTYPAWDFICLEIVQVLCIQSQSLWVHMCNCTVISGEHCFYCLWPLLLWWSLNHGRKKCDTDIPFQIVSFSLCLDQLWVPVLVDIYCKRSFSDEGRGMHMSITIVFSSHFNITPT